KTIVARDPGTSEMFASIGERGEPCGMPRRWRAPGFLTAGDGTKNGLPASEQRTALKEDRLPKHNLETLCRRGAAKKTTCRERPHYRRDTVSLAQRACGIAAFRSNPCGHGREPPGSPQKRSLNSLAIQRRAAGDDPALLVGYVAQAGQGADAEGRRH